jgi:GNAT superfamily N-acetyltransferase
MIKKSLVIRKMQLSDLPQLMRLKNEAGWNQTREDWRFLIKCEQNVNFVLESDDRTIGCLTGMNYDNHLAWIGMMLIDKIHRGQGLSRLLLDRMIKDLSQCNVIKLDATPAGLPIYINIGFSLDYKIWRWTNPNVNKVHVKNKYKIEPVTDKNFQKIAKFDEAIFGVNRMGLLTYLKENSGTLAMVVMDEEHVLGYSLCRKGLNFTQIGPVCANSDELAIALIEAILYQLSGEAVVVDILEDKDVILKYLQQNGFTMQRPLERMNLNDKSSPGRVGKYYLIAGPEFG